MKNSYVAISQWNFATREWWMYRQIPAEIKGQVMVLTKSQRLADLLTKYQGDVGWYLDQTDAALKINDKINGGCDVYSRLYT